MRESTMKEDKTDEIEAILAEIRSNKSTSPVTNLRSEVHKQNTK